MPLVPEPFLPPPQPAAAAAFVRLVGARPWKARMAGGF